MARRKPWVVLQHVPFEGPALIATMAEDAGFSLDCRRLDLDEPVPAPSDVPELGGLVVMGGPMGATDDAQHPFLAAERRLLAAAVEADVPVLGVCLGAQLLAVALGAELTTGGPPEIGLGGVELTPAGRADPVLGPAGRSLPVLHWHADTTGVPAEASHLAFSPAYPMQAFRAGKLAYGLQFHVEINEDAATAMQPHLPAEVRLPRRHLALLQRTGRGVLQRFFAAAAAVRA